MGTFLKGALKAQPGMAPGERKSPMFWNERTTARFSRGAKAVPASSRAENRNGDSQSELLMSLEQLLIANMLWMSR